MMRNSWTFQVAGASGTAIRAAVLITALLASTPSSPAQSRPGSQPSAGATERRLGQFVRQIDKLARPSGAAFGADGGFFLLEAGAGRVSRFSADGTAKGSWGKRGTGPGEMLEPGGIAVDKSGRVYVADTGNRRIQVFDEGGRPVAAWSDVGLIQPVDVSVWPGGAVVADAGSRELVFFGFDGRRTKTLPCGEPLGVIRPDGVSVGEDGSLVVVDGDHHRVARLSSDGTKAAGWGENGPALGMLSGPTGAAMHDGLIYIADRVNHRIQAFTPAGGLRFAWGVHALRPREGEGKLHYPSRVAISRDGSAAVVCEEFEDRVQLFGLRPANYIEPPVLIPPGDMVASHYGVRASLAAGLMALTDQDNQSVQVFDLRGREPVEISRFGGFGAGHGQFVMPMAVALSSDGKRLVVADRGQDRLAIYRLERDPGGELKYLPNMGRLARTVGLAALTEQLPRGGTASSPRIEPLALVLDVNDRLHILDGNRGQILVFDRELKFERTIGARGTGADDLVRPAGLAVAADGRVFVSDAGRGCVQVYGPDGARMRSVGQPGSGEGELSDPFGVAVDGDGRLFVTDVSLHRVTCFGSDGTHLRTWGVQGLSRSEFFKPRDLGITLDGRLIVIDHGNHRGQVFDRDGNYLEAFGARLFILPARRATPRWASGPASSSAPSVATRPATAPASRPTAPTSRAAWKHKVDTADGSFRVSFSTRPAEIPFNEMFQIDFEVATLKPGEGSAELKVLVDAAMPEHQHGMNTQPRVEKNADGTYTAKGMLLHMSGHWEIYFDVTRGAVTERAQFDFEMD